MGIRRKKTTKRKRGRGTYKSALSFNQEVKRARQEMRRKPSSSFINMAKQALTSIGTKNVSRSKIHIIPIPKDDFFPLSPFTLFATLVALGSIGGDAAGWNGTDAAGFQGKVGRREKT